MSEFKQYRRTTIAEMRPYEEGEDLASQDITINPLDQEAGSPRVGDMVARNPADHGDQWLVAQAYFEQNFEPA